MTARWAGIALWFGMIAQTAGADDARAGFARFQDATRQYRARMSQIKASAEIRETSGPRRPGTPGQEVLVRQDFTIDGLKTVVHREATVAADPAVYVESVECFDGTSIFAGMRHQRSAPLELQTFRRLELPIPPGSDPFYPSLNQYFLAPALVASLTADELERNPYFKLGRLESVDGYQRIYFDLDDPGLIHGSGWFETGEKSNWLLHRLECRHGRLRSPRKVRTIVGYGTFADGLPTPERVDLTIVPVVGGSFAEGQFRLRDCELFRANRTDFSPTTYHLPDRSRATRRRQRFSISQVAFWLGAGLLCLALLIKVGKAWHQRQVRAREATA